MRRVEGEVYELRCGSCGGDFATFVFSGDTDMVAAGLETATSTETGEVVVGARLPSEMQDLVSGRDQFAKRISEERGVKFSPVPLLRVEQAVPTGAGFSAFRRDYKPPELVFGCPRCGGEARVTRQEPAAAYIMRGGAISTVGVSLN